MPINQKILISVPGLSGIGGVTSFWNALFNSFKDYRDIHFKILEIGGHGKNILGPIMDQWKFHKSCTTEIDSALINPSLLNKSFFRDGFFAKQLSSKKIPFIVFFHGWDLDFEKVVEKRYINFFLNSFGQAETIFVLSEDFKKKIIEWGYQGEIVVETTMVDGSLISDFSFKEREEDINKKETIKILFLARIVRTKGVFRTIEAFKNLSKEVDNIELIIAGEGEDFDEVKQVSSDTKNIHVIGNVQGQAKIDIFKACDIYCFPTNYGEGLPISVLEAMLFGMAVITTHDGGLKYFFQDEKMGYRVDPTDIDELTEKIKILVQNREKIIEFGKFNFNYAQEHLTNTTAAKRLYPYLKRESNNVNK
jgi:glycosyltransferase involved in cell wall biosynthesis